MVFEFLGSMSYFVLLQKSCVYFFDKNGFLAPIDG